MYYFSKKIPEDIIWSDEYALSRLVNFDKTPKTKYLKNIKKGDSKEWFVNLCKETYGDLIYLKAIHKEFIINWLKKEDESYNSLKEIINCIKNK